MKAATVLLRVGGAANVLFFAFHLLLGWRIHSLTRLDAGTRAVMDLLNGGEAVFIAFLAFASLACARDVLTTRLGRTVLAVATAFYLARALCEFFVMPAFGLIIFVPCLVTGAVYASALMLVRRTPAVPASNANLLPTAGHPLR